MSVAAIPIEHSIAPRIEVQWHCLDVDDEAAARLTALLSPGEVRHAERFHFATDRRRYCVRRGILRELLAHHLSCGPREIAITHNDFGKPHVEGTDVRFNLSHSRGMALYAFARGPEIGCDVEWQDSRFPIRGTAELVLSRAEIESLQLLPERQRTRAFFYYWTCKEAYLKARGAGFALPPQEITVSLVGTPCFVALPEDDPAEWSLAPIDPAPGYVAMLAVRGSAPTSCTLVDRYGCPGKGKASGLGRSVCQCDSRRQAKSTVPSTIISASHGGSNSLASTSVTR